MCKDMFNERIKTGHYVCIDIERTGSWKVTKLLSHNRIRIESNNKSRIINANKCYALPFF